MEPSNVDRIIAQVSNGTTLHATSHLVRKKFYEIQMDDPEVHDLLVKVSDRTCSLQLLLLSSVIDILLGLRDFQLSITKTWRIEECKTTIAHA